MILNLEVRRFLDLEAFEHGLQVFSFRVWTRVAFQGPHHDWTPTLSALIDTGAPFCVLPKSVWLSAEVNVAFATTLRGLIPSRSAVLPARFGQVTCVISDLKNRAAPLKLWALLAEGEVPLVLGCAGFLDRARLMLDAPHLRASLEL